MKNNRTTHLITFGRGGATAYQTENGNSTHRLSGYWDPEETFTPYHWWSHPSDQMSHHVEPGTAEGAIVVDMRDAVATPEGYTWAIRGPMPDISLSDDAVERCPEPSPIFANAVADNQFGTLLTLQKAHNAAGSTEPGPLDYVSPRTFAAGWKKRGARIGTVRKNAIVWDD